MQVTVYNTKAEKIGTTNLPEAMFKALISESLMAQAVKVYLSNQRQSPAKAKTRGEITSYSTRKLYKQKGTGRARHGDRKAPIFVKGGKAHGPTGEQNYQLKMNKNMRRLALFSALTSKLKNKEIIVVSGLEKIEPKTKIMSDILNKFKTSTSTKATADKQNSKMSAILPKALDNVVKSGRNLKNLNLLQANSLNTYEILNGGQIILMKDSIGVLEQTYGIK